MTSIPSTLAEIIEEFNAVPDPEKLQLLLEFSRQLPALPERYDGHEEEMEQVVECQTPLFLAVEVAPEAPHKTEIFFSAPAEAPTTRGFASVFSEGLDGATADEILAVPDDIANALGLAKAITPLRLRGMTAMLGRLKRNIRTQLEAA
ncbi:SufE family protein [Micrococcoides hystricis]|uniref:SufE family protein n=1 Tax=Micrococcoides hystricis TaxID=1572761 RepID=A0ABV6P6Y9_9MICC